MAVQETARPGARGFVEEQIRQLGHAIGQSGGCPVTVSWSTAYVLLRLAGQPIPPKLQDAAREEWEMEVDAYLGGRPASPIEELRKALEPFATFAADNVDEDGWTSTTHRERIVDWFGPSDFRKLAETLDNILASKPLPPTDDVRAHCRVLTAILEGIPDYEGDDPRALHYRERRQAIKAAIAALSAQSPPPADDAEADLVARFSAALLAKLRASEVKYGWRRAWMRPDWQNELPAKLLKHVQKGDPIDVAAYAAFAWHHGWSVQSPPPIMEEGLVKRLRAVCGEGFTREHVPVFPGYDLTWADLRAAATALATPSLPEGMDRG